MTALIEEGMAQGEFSAECRPHETASGLIGMLDALVLQAWLDHSFNALETGRICLDNVLRGLTVAKEVK